jgi:hypothetical protein
MHIFTGKSYCIQIYVYEVVEQASIDPLQYKESG